MIRILKYLALVIFGIVLSVGLLEIGLRVAGFQPATYLRKFSRYHPVLGWEKTPNMEGYFQRGNARIHERLNAKGLRSSDVDYPKPGNVYRILFLGDSFTEGYDVAFDDLFTMRLEKALGAAPAGKRIEVINAGTGGYSPDQEYLYYRTEGFKYAPDLVVMMMYPANDVYYTIKSTYGNYSKPLFQFHDSTLVAVNLPLPKPRDTEAMKNLFRGLALYQFLLTRVLPQSPGLSRFLGKAGLVSSETVELATHAGNAPSSFDIYRREGPKEVCDAWRITKGLIRATKAFADSSGSAFILFSIPDRFQIYDASWKQTQTNYGVNDSLWDRSRPESILSDYCTHEGIHFINFLDSLRAVHTSASLYNAVHWNEQGNAEAAIILEGAIMNWHLLEKVSP